MATFGARLLLRSRHQVYMHLCNVKCNFMTNAISISSKFQFNRMIKLLIHFIKVSRKKIDQHTFLKQSSGTAMMEDSLHIDHGPPALSSLPTK